MNLASNLFDQGDYPAAHLLEERCLAIRSRVLGDEHPDTLNSMNNLAETLNAQGDFAAARTLQEKCLEIQSRTLGDEHPHTVTSMINLSYTLNNQNETESARNLQKRVLGIRLKKYGRSHSKTTIIQWLLLNTAAKLDDSDQVISLVEDMQWLETADEDTLSPDQISIRDQLMPIFQSPNTGQQPSDAFLAEANSYRHAQDWYAAIFFYNLALEAALSTNRFDEAMIMRNWLALCWIRLEKGNRAVPHLKAAIQQPDNQGMTGILYNNLGSALKIEQRWREAYVSLCSSIDWALQPHNDPSVLAYSYDHLADVLHQLNDHQNAAYYGESSLERWLEANNHHRGKATVEALIKIYEKLDNQTRINELNQLLEQWP